MKLFILMFTLLILVSCGKDNHSGHTESKGLSPLTVQEEEAIRQDFIREGREIMSRFEDQIKQRFGLRTAGLIRARLRHENIHLSEAILYSDMNLITRSTVRNSLLTLYVGSERPELSWTSYHRARSQAYTRLVMHELLLLAEVDDRNFFYTDQILRLR